jgi:NAD-dependent deacetylase
MIDKAVEILRNVESLFVLTGAGISAESGIPTFRGEDGLWKNYSATDLATPEAFNKDPTLVWTWYRWRQGIIKRAHPNPGHTALVDLEKTIDTFLLLTQNVDNLHHALHAAH